MWRRHLSAHDREVILCSCEFQSGRFRKGQRIGGCGNSKCYLCHSEKLLGIPTQSTLRAEISWREYCLEIGVGEAPNKAFQTDEVAEQRR